jgi:hypothetical protein
MAVTIAPVTPALSHSVLLATQNSNTRLDCRRLFFRAFKLGLGHGE